MRSVAPVVVLTARRATGQGGRSGRRHLDAHGNNRSQ